MIWYTINHVAQIIFGLNDLSYELELIDIFSRLYLFIKRENIMMFFLNAFMLLLFLSYNSFSAAEKLDWSQWRGPNRDGILISELPEHLSGLQKKWEIDLSPSYSGPVTYKGKVFTTATVDEEYEVVYCYNAATGELIWTSKWLGAMKVPFFAASNGSWIKSTPTVADGKIFVAGMRDVLTCLNVENGEQIWQVDFVEQFETTMSSFGFVCSPLVYQDKVVVQASGGIFQLNIDTGEVIWQALKDSGGMYGGAFSSPIIEVIDNDLQLIVQTRTELASVNWQNGEKLWGVTIPAFRGMNIQTPSRYENSFFTSSYGGGSFLYELDSGILAKESKWSNTIQGYMSSPLILKDHVYMHLRNQRVTCMDLQTGEIAWTSKPFGKYWSMVTDGDRILGLDQRGVLYLVNASPDKFEIIDKQKISKSETWAHLAVSRDKIYVRSLDKLICFSLES